MIVPASLPQDHRHNDPDNPLARVRPLGGECLHCLVHNSSAFTMIVNLRNGFSMDPRRQSPNGLKPPREIYTARVTPSGFARLAGGKFVRHSPTPGAACPGFP